MRAPHEAPPIAGLLEAPFLGPDLLHVRESIGEHDALGWSVEEIERSRRGSIDLEPQVTPMMVRLLHDFIEGDG